MTVKVTYQTDADPEDSELSVSIGDSHAAPLVGDLVVITPFGADVGKPYLVTERYWTLEEHETDKWLQHLTVIVEPRE